LVIRTAAKINGRYWMYWGEREVYLATSSELIDCSPVETEPGKLLVGLSRRSGEFDRALVEGGPLPVLTEKGIVAHYNGF
jgi:beta-1,2-mannosidase